MKTRKLLNTLNAIAAAELGTRAPRHRHYWQHTGPEKMLTLHAQGKPITFTCACGQTKTISTKRHTPGRNGRNFGG